MAEQQTSFDAAQYKNAQREQWNKDGAAWRRWTPTLERWYGVATRQMLDLAMIQPGQRILDVALVVDATGSMADEIDALRRSLRDVVARIRTLPNLGRLRGQRPDAASSRSERPVSLPVSVRPTRGSSK